MVPGMPEIGSEWDFIILILRTLRQAGPVNQTKLAQLTGAHKNKIGRYVEALATRGLVEKRLDPGPPRQTVVTLTRRGGCVVSCLEEEI